MENIDVFDANLNFKDVIERKEAHTKGIWHQTFHCWVVNPKNKSILFQLRSKEKRIIPICLILVRLDIFFQAKKDQME